MCDFQVVNEGSIFLLVPHSLAALEWVEDNIPEDAMRYGRSVVVEHRYIWDIIAGATCDGLSVQPCG